jgi:DUF1365 family protein
MAAPAAPGTTTVSQRSPTAGASPSTPGSSSTTFLPIDGLDHRFVFSPPSPDQQPEERVAVHMDVSDAQGHLFHATVGQVRQPLTTCSLWRQLLRMPWVTVKTIVAIHWEALFIWRRKDAIERAARALGDRRAA